MDEQANTPVEEQILVPIQEPKKSNTIKKVFIGLSALLAVYIVYSILDIFLSPDRNIQQIYLVPDDAVFIIQSSDPVNDWSKFSESESWKTLKRAKALEEIVANAEQLDSIVHENKTLLSLVGERDMLISVHKTRTADFDFLIILDLLKTAKLNLLKDQIETIIKLAGSIVTQRTYNKINILEIKDPQTREIMYLAFVDNHVVVSFTSRLVEAAIDSRHTPKIGLDYTFMEADKLIAGKGLFRMFVNYAQLPQFMTLFLDEPNEYINTFSQSMDYAGLYLNSNKNKIELKGYTFKKESADPYVTALLRSGKHKMEAHNIMSARTAVYTNIGINSPKSFVKELEAVLSSSNQELNKVYTDSRKKIESMFGISLEENFLSWMSGEIAIAQLQPGLLGQDPELILAIGAKSQKTARKNMEFIEKKIKNRTPIKVKAVEYKGYEIHYVEMKGFFRLFFGKMFDKFEKPYYTYLDDYVLFSNKPSSLLSFIEDYEQKNLLKNDAGFKKAISQFESSSTLFVFTDMHKFFPQLKTMLNTSTWTDINRNKDILYSFPYWSTQVTGNPQSASLQYVMEYEPYDPLQTVTTTDSDDEEEDQGEDEENEDQQMNELKRFYIEKFQGNIWREFYPDGNLKSETEIKDGRRHGRHREYYEDGKLKLRGKYSNNRPKGTWKYYNEEGKQQRKEKF